MAARLSRREIEIVCALADPRGGSLKEIAYTLHITYETLRRYLSSVYTKLGWYRSSTRELALWAIAHRETLGIELPTPEQFARPAARAGGAA